MKRDLYRKYSVGERLILYSFPPPFLISSSKVHLNTTSVLLELGRIKCAPFFLITSCYVF